jgi:bifunctional non-homologous end joining protein LigD
MDDETLAICVFVGTHPKVLETVRSLTENDAVEAGASLEDLRRMLCIQAMQAHADEQNLLLDDLVHALARPSEASEAESESNGQTGLEKYNRMRDFDASPEPTGVAKPKTGKGRAKRDAQALQYCVQKHDATRLHYDFRLELEGTLKSWAIPKGPCLDPEVKRLAVHVEDHPLDYATFEGTIPEGHYGAGEVIVWDRGIWTPTGDPIEGYRKGRLKFELQGEKLAGQWNLVRTHIPGKQEQWFLIKHQDATARSEAEYDIVEELPNSVLSDRTIIPKQRGKGKAKKPRKSTTSVSHASEAKQQGHRAALFDTLSPELATLVETSPKSDDWRYEIKFDGYRMLARIDHGKVRLFTRNGHDWTAKLPHQAKALSTLGLETAWLDGEIVIPDDNGVPDFQLLQNAFDAGTSAGIVYYLFDLPYLNGFDLREVPVEARRGALRQLLGENTDSLLRFSDDFEESPDALLNSACSMQMEGLIGKRAGSPYVSRRSDDWIKLKCSQRHEFVVVGYSDPKGSRSGFGALLLGLNNEDGGELKFAGRVGTGFTEATLKTILSQLRPLETHACPVANPPTGSDARGIHWLEPNLLAEVSYAEMTKDGVVRHAVFRGLRADKPPEDITQEKAQPAPKANTGKSSSSKRAPKKATDQSRIRITHPERIIDASSGTTKMQLAQYYAAVSPWLLPHLADRPVALVRAPEGIGGELFFQKNAEKLSIPGITAIPKAEAGKAAMVINNAEALVGAVQMSTIELHSWNATTADLNLPDRFVLDLDPDPALPWKSMVEATQLTLTVLDELGLRAFLKTSGGKGIHLVVPLTPGDSWDDVKAFSQGIVKYMAKLIPERFVAVLGPKNRVGRIFIDYLRNSKGATTVNAYAARARPGLAVSVPIYREEMLELKGADVWNIHNLHERLTELGADDPWADYAVTAQQITQEMREMLGIR